MAYVQIVLFMKELKMMEAHVDQIRVARDKSFLLMAHVKIVKTTP